MPARRIECPFGERGELLAVIGDAAAGTAERERRPDDRRKPDLFECRRRFLDVACDHRARTFETDPFHRLAKQLAVFGLGDRRSLGADHLDAVRRQYALLVQVERGVQGGLPAHRRQKGKDAPLRHVRLFADDDLFDEVRRDGLDIGRIGEARVGHDRRGVRIDQHHAVAFGFQRLAGLCPGIVEFAGLADDDGPGADDQNAVDIVPPGHHLIPVTIRTQKKALARRADSTPPAQRALLHGIYERRSALHRVCPCLLEPVVPDRRHIRVLN